MSALIPRLLGDLTDWLDADLVPRAGHLIRVEDHITDKEYQLRAELPGMDPDKDIQVSVDHGVLFIRAERREHEQFKGRSEFRYGLLQRSIRLPANADAEHIVAGYTNGVLEVTVPLTGQTPTGRQIPVTVT